MIKMTKYPKGFYVYAYLREKDSNNGLAGSPYYIGKGKEEELGIFIPLLILL
jgi:hypothetical protein